jgi:hypothetical protein
MNPTENQDNSSGPQEKIQPAFSSALHVNQELDTSPPQFMAPDPLSIPPIPAAFTPPTPTASPFSSTSSTAEELPLAVEEQTAQPEVREPQPVGATPIEATQESTSHLGTQSPQEQIPIANQKEYEPPKTEVSPAQLGTAQLESVRMPVAAKDKKVIWRNVSIAAVAFLVITLPVYFWLLPGYWNGQYSAAVTPSYDQQTAKMLTTYVSFGAPVFTSNTTSQQTDAKNITDANAAIKAATSSTNDLDSKNHLIILPATTLVGSTNQTNQKYQATKQYVQDSRAFLTEYQTLVTYVNSMEQIDTSQLPAVLTNLRAINGSQNAAQVLATSQTASASLSALITSLGGLQPSTDLRQYNATMIQDLTAVNAALEGIITGINDKSTTEIAAAATQLSQAGATLDSYSSTDIAGMLQKSSLIHRQIVKLEGENPLGRDKPTTTPANAMNGGMTT